MGQTTLVVVLLDGAYTLCDVEVGLVLRIVVVSEIIGQTIVEFAYSDILVNR